MTEARDRIARAQRLVEAMLDKKAEDVVALDVREVSSFADTFIIASGSSDRHVRSIADAVEQASGGRPRGVEGIEEGRWVLIDLDDVIVHVFQPAVRRFYDLERLWGDAPVMDLALREVRSTAR